MAKLYFRYGAMNSGKSTAMLQAAYNYEERGQHVLLAKPAVDTKGADEIASRLGVSRPVDFLIGPDDAVRTLFATHRARVQREAAGSLVPESDVTESSRARREVVGETTEADRMTSAHSRSMPKSTA